MKRVLLKQMRYEWRDNIWMVLGLAIVALAVWYMTTSLVNVAHGLFYPLGVDTKDVCKINILSLPETSPDYIDRGEDSKEADSQDLRMLISAIRNSPYVEAAAFSNNGLPYSLSFMGNYLRMAENDTISYPFNFREMSPDMMRVLKIKSLTGKSTDQLVELLRNGEYLISNYTLENPDGGQPEEYYGHLATFNNMTAHRVGDIVQIMRRSDYDINNWGMLIRGIDESGNFECREMAVRVKPGMKEKFIEDFENTPSMQKYGNKMLYNLEFLDDIAIVTQSAESSNMRMTLGLNTLLIIIVAIGIMGVFWFRVQQRLSETAIRKVCGATNGDIFRRIISEGLILLGLAAVVAIAIGWPLMNASILSKADASTMIVVLTGVLTFAFMAIALVVCIWIPARKAMHIEPAIAIKDE